MRADNSHHIVSAARRLAAATRRRAIAALRRMANAGQAISFDAVAREAKVSRSWLYNQPDLRAEIERLRARWDPAPARQRLPDRQRASDASLRWRLEVMTERNRQLETEKPAYLGIPANQHEPLRCLCPTHDRAVMREVGRAHVDAAGLFGFHRGQ